MEINYPPYTITDKMLNYVSDIMKKIGEANYFEIIINGGNQKDDIDKTVPTTFSISDKIIVKFYPSVSLSKESSDCRIEITTTIYN